MKKAVQTLLIVSMLPLAGCKEFLANYPQLGQLLQERGIELEAVEPWVAEKSVTCIGEVCVEINDGDGQCGEQCDEAKRKTDELLEDPSREAGEEYAKWLVGELPKVGEPLDVLLKIYEGIKLYEGRHDNFIKLLRAIQANYAQGTDSTKIDVCKALADLFGYPLTGANLSHCMDQLSGRLSPDEYRRIRRVIEEMIRRVNADRQA